MSTAAEALDSFAQAEQEERSLSAERAMLAERFHDGAPRSRGR